MLTAATNRIYVGRQPILDREGSLYAYELLFRGGCVDRAEFSCDLSATARVITSVFNELGLERALGNAFGFINVSESLLMSEAIELLPADKIVIELLETIRPTPEVIARSRELCRKGFRLALDDVLDLDDALKPLVEIASFIKIDLLGIAPEALPDLVERFRPYSARLLAEKVDNADQARHCRELGFHYFQGYFFARPSVLSTRSLTAGETTLFRLLSLVMADADTAEMEPLIKHEPALLVNLMRISNSIGNGSNRRISTAREAITLLGRRQLQRWLQLLLFCVQSDGSAPTPMLNMAATRARTMELLVEEMNFRSTPDRAFLVGILSLLPALLGVTMDEVLSTLAVVPEIRNALTRGDGELGTLLELLDLWERGQATEFARLIESLPPLTVEDFNRIVADAMSWAASLGT